MSLALIGKGASYEFRWRRWALLRDAVAVHLEGGTSGAAYPRFAAIGDALFGVQRLPAAELASELRAVRAGLEDQPVTALVIAETTAAVLYMGARIAAPRLLTASELTQVAPVGSARSLAEYFASMIDSMAEVCAAPFDDGLIDVVDG
jgi:hypothetical protein